MSFEEPIVKYYGAKIGQVFRILRANLENPSMLSATVNYRLITGTKMSVRPTSTSKEKESGETFDLQDV